MCVSGARVASLSQTGGDCLQDERWVRLCVGGVQCGWWLSGDTLKHGGHRAG